MRVRVTGGAGFIGSHVVDTLIGAGHEVSVVDSLWSHGGGRRENVNPKAAFHQLDITTPAFAALVRAERPEAIAHHAAQHSVKLSTDDPAYDATVNILGLINLLTAAAAAGTRKVTFASSGATYGTPERLPVDEATPQRPESPYGITKMTSEHYLRYWRAAHNIRYTALRYGNVYGPRQDPNGEAGVIAIFAKRMLTGQGVRIDWDGEQSKDYVYVGDVARANLLALQSGDDRRVLHRQRPGHLGERDLSQLGGADRLRGADQPRPATSRRHLPGPLRRRQGCARAGLAAGGLVRGGYPRHGGVAARRAAGLTPRLTYCSAAWRMSRSWMRAPSASTTA